MSRGRKPVVQCTLAEWRAAVKRIQAAIPPPEGYSWRFVWSVSLEDKFGECDRSEPKLSRRGVITIKIAKGMSESETVSSLIHEVAHAFDDWHHHSWQGDHNDIFWIWVGRVYRRYWGFETG